MAQKQNFYLVGIKGVAMAALAQVLLDAGQHVYGSDVAEEFVTEHVLLQRGIHIDNFTASIPEGTDCVVFTAAHKASLHPQVQEAQAKGITTLSHAEALATWFNQKQGIAVCGVGGKSTISAMLAWILEKANQHPSYAVGVGDIIGLERSGKWDQEGSMFVAEADEYVTDPIAVQNGATLIPRFHYLEPDITIASTISFDHPDVYQNETHTRSVFTDWFSQLSTNGVLISSDENRDWLEQRISHIPIRWYGQSAESDLVLCRKPEVRDQRSIASVLYDGKEYELSLRVPGTYNMLNALAAMAAAQQLGVSIEKSILHLANFSSTMRRFEHVGSFNQVEYYDDYAHHPRELKVVLEAARQWFGAKRLVVAFQPHTYSRTKALFNEFVAALQLAPELLLLDIFGSARESTDPSISSDLLCNAILKEQTSDHVQNLHTIKNLANYCKQNLGPGDVLLTLGAGDIYKVHALLGVTHV